MVKQRELNLFNYLLTKLPPYGGNEWMLQGPLSHAVIKDQPIRATGATPQHTVATDFNHLRKFVLVAQQGSAQESSAAIIWKTSTAGKTRSPRYQYQLGPMTGNAPSKIIPHDKNDPYQMETDTDDESSEPHWSCLDDDESEDEPMPEVKELAQSAEKEGAKQKTPRTTVVL